MDFYSPISDGMPTDGIPRRPRRRPVFPPAPTAPTVAMPQVDPAALGQRAEATIPIQREPWDERLPDGRSVSEAIRQLEPRDAGILSSDDPRAQERRGRMVSPASGPDGLPAKRGGFSDRMAQIDMLRRAPVTSEVHRREKGGWQTNAEYKKPSRLKQALIGALQGAVIGASKTGSLAGALGGAGTGAAAGGISPRLMKTFTRDQEIRRLQGQLDDDMQLQKGQTDIEAQQAQTAYNQKRARTGDKRYVERKDGVYEISDEFPQGRRVGNIGPEGDTEETLVDYTDPEGRTFKVKANEAANLYQRDRKPVGSDAQEAQAAEGVVTEDEAGKAIGELKKELDDLRGPYDAGVKSIAQKNAIWKAKAAKLVADDPTGETTLAEAMERVKADDPDFVSGVYGETESNTKSKAERIVQLEKEILDINKERRGGKAKAARGGTGGKKGGRFSGQVLPRANLKAAAERWKVTPEEAERIFTGGGGLIK